PVHAVAGIGNPERFFRHLEGAGLAVVRHAFPDHHTYTESDFGFAGDDSVILMTEKDAVKCDHLDIAGDVFCVPVSARISPGFFAAVQRHLDIRSAPRNPEP
ncbi:MAG: tetraacyldisaccharide 4'-kinase, partial [Gammaproteobacteria bacterium]|nr:tetraacyldisaccharide 4'-kinase [Gammaproteobacteria bacterium]